MNTETLKTRLQVMGVPDWQAHSLGVHIEQAEKFIYPSDPGIERGMLWLKESLFSTMEVEDARVLFRIAQSNKPTPEVEYAEQGYDSCQSHRKIAKVVGEAILLGGLVYEADLVGIPLDFAGAQVEIKSDLRIEKEDGQRLIGIARKYGGKQDFLFPGITPSSETTPSLSDLAYLAIRGNPKTTVRTLTGVGGLRHDKEWNYAVDLATFADLKVAEDKRYYPGIGAFYLLMKSDFASIPTINTLQQSQPGLFAALSNFVDALKTTRKLKFSGVSVLCSAYLPPWEEIKSMQGFVSNNQLELAEAFHSPSYDFVTLRSILEQVNSGKIVAETEYSQLLQLTKKLNHCWSFNSTIHLPWTAELANLSNNFIGRITNQLGDYAIRYGVGYKGKSLEVREYCFGQERNFPHGLAGEKGYEVRFYPESDCFGGAYHSSVLTLDSFLVEAITKEGFMKAALNYLKNK